MIIYDGGKKSRVEAGYARFRGCGVYFFTAQKSKFS
jgi:hypothetical protein